MMLEGKSLVHDHGGVLPDTAKLSHKGHLEIGGCDTVDLAARFGTPLFVYDQATLRNRCRSYKSAFSSYPTEIVFAGKAFCCKAMCALIAAEGLSLDVSTGGEMHTALSAGFPAERILFHGNNKTPEELRLALENKIGRIVVDSDDELDLLGSIAGEMSVKPAIMLRITPGIKVYTHEYLETGEVDSKFGFTLRGGVAERAVKRALENPDLDLVGIHAHIGSQIFALHSYSKAIDIVFEFLLQIKKTTGWTAKELNVGGGLGIKYMREDAPSSIEELAQIILDELKAQIADHDYPAPKLFLEPGRSIVANAAITLYSVGTIKEIPQVKTYISVDGGMSDNMRPSLYGAVYEAFLANRMEEEPNTRVSIAGKHCETGDILIKDTALPQPARGDVLGLGATGAYGYAMANNYNRQPRPAVVMVDKGDARIIIRRETWEDVCRLDQT